MDKTKSEGFSETPEPDHKPNIEIVVARFNENLDWLKDEPFNKYPVICYNSGKNDDFYKPDNMTVVKIPDIGKEAYTYLYHIVNRYDNIAEITIFLPGSANNNHKKQITKRQVYEVEDYKNTVFLSSKTNDVQKDYYDFQLDSWCSTSSENIKENAECKLHLSKTRPFGKWYEVHFNNIHTQHVNYFGILGIHRRHIVQNPKEKYENLLALFEKPNDEIAHYFERAWEAVFYPMDGAVFNKIF